MKQSSSHSAGLLMVRRVDSRLEVLLVHPGGPFWAKKDTGAWSIPKGLTEPGESLVQAAQREFEEETGFTAQPPFIHLGSVRLKSGKQVHAWAVVGDCNPDELRSNSFDMEWPPKSGKTQTFPEVDRCAFFSIERAKSKINQAQVPFLERLMANPDLC